MLARQPSRLAPEHCRPFLGGLLSALVGGNGARARSGRDPDQDVVVWMREWVGGAGMNWGDGGVGQAIISFQHGVWALERCKKKVPVAPAGGCGRKEEGNRAQARKFYSTVGSDEPDLQRAVSYGCADEGACNNVHSSRRGVLMLHKRAPFKGAFELKTFTREQPCNPIQFPEPGGRDSSLGRWNGITTRYGGEHSCLCPLFAGYITARSRPALRCAKLRGLLFQATPSQS